MKITMNGANEAFFRSKVNKEKQAPKKAEEKTDKITISAHEPKNDAQFISGLKNQILNELKAGESADKLQDLKKQISSGEYDINAMDVARKMLLV